MEMCEQEEVSPDTLTALVIFDMCYICLCWGKPEGKKNGQQYIKKNQQKYRTMAKIYILFFHYISVYLRKRIRKYRGKCR